MQTENNIMNKTNLNEINKLIITTKYYIVFNIPYLFTIKIERERVLKNVTRIMLCEFSG